MILLIEIKTSYVIYIMLKCFQSKDMCRQSSTTGIVFVPILKL